MSNKKELISAEEAKRQVALVCRRLGLLHMAFAKTLVEQLGEEKGKKLIIKAIEEYGRNIGRSKREIARSRGLEPSVSNLNKLKDIPSIGMHESTQIVETEGQTRQRAYSCVMAQIWKEYDQEAIGRFYCYVDAISTMAYNPEFKCVHTKLVPDGDDFCEFVIRPTSKEERSAFESGDIDWQSVDKN